jgi:hypothetical protein
MTNLGDSLAKVGYNEWGALSHSTTDDPRLNLFFKTVRNTPEETLHNLLEESWNLDPLDTLKIIFNLRDCRGGKGEKKQFQLSMIWVLENHYKNFIENCEYIPYYGSYKDWLNFIILPKAQEEILDLWCSQLQKDTISEGNVSLAGKWAPSENKSYDKKYKLVKLFCNKLHISHKNYRKMLANLRTKIHIVEQYMSSQQWNNIDFSKLTSYNHKVYKKAWKRHLSEKYTEYISNVKQDKTKMNVKVLHPHEIVSKYFNSNELDETLEAQWYSFLKMSLEKWKLGNCLSIVDVSGSMSGLPIHVAVSLGLLVSHITNGYFHKRFITFSETPNFEEVKGDSLRDMVMNMKKAHWDCSTNIQKVFDLILSTAIRYKIPAEGMPNTLFIFSDMQFQAACPRNRNTNFEVIEQKYKDAGYIRPTIIFWNLRGDTADFPIEKDVPKTILVSGFSPSLLDMFVEGEGFNALQFMFKIIRSERYSQIKYV